jgi:hypothetical protein
MQTVLLTHTDPESTACRQFCWLIQILKVQHADSFADSYKSWKHSMQTVLLTHDSWIEPGTPGSVVKNSGH